MKFQLKLRNAGLTRSDCEDVGRLLKLRIPLALTGTAKEIEKRQSLRIWVAEDNSVNLQLVKRLLEKRGTLGRCRQQWSGSTTDSG